MFVCSSRLPSIPLPFADPFPPADGCCTAPAKVPAMPKKPTDQPVVRISVTLPVEIITRLREIAAERAVSVSEVIRAGIDHEISMSE